MVDDDWSVFHGSFVFIYFGSSAEPLVIKNNLDLCIIISKPNNKGQCQVLNTDDYRFYPITIPETVNSNHIFIA